MEILGGRHDSYRLALTAVPSRRKQVGEAKRSAVGFIAEAPIF